MNSYTLPTLTSPAKLPNGEAALVASGDLRLSANQVCWPAQQEMEQRVLAAFAREGLIVRRGHAYDPALQHGFIWNQRMGMDVFAGIDPDAPRQVIAAMAVDRDVFCAPTHGSGSSSRASPASRRSRCARDRCARRPRTTKLRCDVA